MVNAGGDLRAFGREPQPVQIRHPLDPLRAAGTVFLRDRALATSASYFAPELFDGRNGDPMREEVSVTFGAADCLTADALTKIALVLRGEAQDLVERHEAEALVLDGKGAPHWLSQNDAADQLGQA
jgi:thiamine biosynthesis lipoprotein